ncbi:MAG: hypothetical protein A2475_12935 [Ignavibacteria bacterium RIFOXYC2_FULL_35_21]|nr:MAG: hypothetical protein A2220_00225 [Ignavibacteria bacterium RIFOXYA2_FULL_35_10]OGV18881.1 MAG: hypothetical protein A2475_12935 [Ignavibacteria bacterium RIFOXYC2_FULL_35_21]
MKFIKIIFIVYFSCTLFLSAKQTIILPLNNLNDTCNQESNISFIDANKDNVFDIFIINNCNYQLYAFPLIVNSTNEIIENQTAYLSQGSIEAKNYIILIFDPNSFHYTHKLYYDNKISKAILEDYTEQGSEPSTYEEADNYFYTQQMGSTLLITKKADIDVQSVFLCSLDGRIISNLQNVVGWSQFSFDMSLEPSGMYLLRFIARDRALTKRVIYLK